MQYDASTSHVSATGRREDIIRDTKVTSKAWTVCEGDQEDNQEDDQTERERPVTSLLDSERLFQTTYERAVIGIAHVSPQGHFLRFNQRLCDIVGYDHEDLATRTFLDITHPDDRDASGVCFQRLLAGETDAYELDKRYVRTDGAPVWVHLTVSLVRTPEGAPDYTISMVQDITERKRLDQERACLLEQERAATHAEVAATNAQLRAMLALTDTALSHLALGDLLRELLGRVTTVMGVDNVGILLLDADGQTLTVRAARGSAEELIDRLRIPVGHGPPGRIAASKAPLIANDLSPFDSPNPWLREALRAVVGVPLLVEEQGEDRLVGVVCVGSVAQRRFTEADVRLLQRAADRIALAIDRARLYAAERDARAQAEAALARATASEAQATERAEHLHTILETIADGVAVSGTDGRLIQTNRAFRELLAADHQPEFDALSFAERAPLLDMRDAATGEPFPLERHPVGRALRGEVVSGPEAEWHMRALDGRELEVDVSAAPLRDGAGRVVGAVSVVRDVAWRRQLERERAAALTRATASEAQATERAKHLHTILETMADGVGVYDHVGRLIQCNRAGRELLAVDRAPAGFDALPFANLNRLFDMRDAVTGEPLSPERTAAVRALRGEVVSGPDAEYRMRALDGRDLEVNASAAPLRDNEGHVVGAVSVLRDQTERKRLEREREAARGQAEVARADELAAREASRRMEAFLATAAHDLRTPLTATLGYVALAQRQVRRLASAVPEEYPDLAHRVEDARSRLEDAGKAGKRLTRLLTLLFDTAAIRADRLELHRTPCDLAALVREQVEALRVAAPDRLITLHALAVDGGTIPVEVDADADRIGQVVTNYVTNALKYAPPDRPVDVSVQACGEGREGQARVARVAVRDAGPGIPKQERTRVWELFHRASGVAAQGGAVGGAQDGSLGLGLYICRAIIKAHGGRVGVRSADGDGSTFWFTLPLVHGVP